MIRIAWILSMLAGLTACERIVDLTPPPDGSTRPDTIVVPDSDLDAAIIEDGGIEDALFDTAPPDAL
jgi:hypothetical protein